MSEAVYFGAVAALETVVQTFPADNGTFMLLEKLPTGWLEFDRHHPDSGLKFATFNEDEGFDTWQRGRVFNQNAELRWEKIESTFHVVYIGSLPGPSGLNRDDSLDLAATAIQRPRAYYLWGQRMSPEQLAEMNWNTTETDIFVELQTPRVLRYPVPTEIGGHLKLHAVEYVDRQTGQLLLYRFKGVKAA